MTRKTVEVLPKRDPRGRRSELTDKLRRLEVGKYLEYKKDKLPSPIHIVRVGCSSLGKRTGTQFSVREGEKIVRIKRVA